MTLFHLFKILWMALLLMQFVHSEATLSSKKLIRYKRASPVCQVYFDDILTLDPVFDLFRNYYKSSNLTKPEDYFTNPDQSCDKSFKELSEYSAHVSSWRKNLNQENKQHANFILKITSRMPTQELIQNYEKADEFIDYMFKQLKAIIDITKEKIAERKELFLSERVCQHSEKPAIVCTQPLSFLTDTLNNLLPNVKSHSSKNCSEAVNELKECLSKFNRDFSIIKSKVTLAISKIPVITGVMKRRKGSYLEDSYANQYEDKVKTYNLDYEKILKELASVEESEKNMTYTALNYTVLCGNFDLANYLFQELLYYGDDFKQLFNIVLKLYNPKKSNTINVIDFISTLRIPSKKVAGYDMIYDLMMENKKVKVSSTDLLLLYYYVQRDSDAWLLDKMNATIEERLVYIINQIRWQDFRIIESLKKHNYDAFKYYVTTFILNRLAAIKKEDHFDYVRDFKFIQYSTDMGPDVIPMFKLFRDYVDTNKNYNKSVDVVFAYGLKIILDKHYGKVDETNQAILMQLIQMVQTPTAKSAVFHSTYIKNRDGYICATDKAYDEKRRVINIQKNPSTYCEWIMEAIVVENKFTIKNRIYGEYLYFDNINFNAKYRRVFTWRDQNTKLPIEKTAWQLDVRYDNNYLNLAFENEFLDSYEDGEMYPALDRERTPGERLSVGKRINFLPANKEVKINGIIVPI